MEDKVTNIRIAGLGGMGVLKASLVLSELLFECGYDVKKAEVHGMSQRGGDVQSNLRISSSPIHSDLIALNGADVVISMEPMEALRYLPYLNKDKGWIITSSVPFVNISNYPAMEDIKAEYAKLGNVVMLDIEKLAKDNGVPRSANVILIGAALNAIGLERDKIEAAIRRVFERKGESVVDANIKALAIGIENSGKI